MLLLRRFLLLLFHCILANSSISVSHHPQPAAPPVCVSAPCVTFSLVFLFCQKSTLFALFLPLWAPSSPLLKSSRSSRFTWILSSLQHFCSNSRSHIHVHTHPQSIHHHSNQESSQRCSSETEGPKCVWAAGLISFVVLLFLAKCAEMGQKMSIFVKFLSCSLCICVSFSPFLLLSPHVKHTAVCGRGLDPL